MKNKVVCNNCKAENDFYELNCKSCGSLLRNKIPNIDLFSTIWLLIESPTNAFKKIIFAEHKNYVSFISVLLILKLVFTSFFLQSLFVEHVDYQNYLALNLGIGFASFLFFYLLFPLFIKILLKTNLVLTRYKDNLALLIYSQIPLVLFLVFILPIEFALFGKFWLFSNPSPFMIKETAAYAFSIMELLTLLWSVILFGIANYIQSKSKTFAVIIALFYLLILFGFFLYIPYLR